MLENRASLLLRAIAKSIDFIIIMAAIEALPQAGWLAGLIYLLISDGLMDGRSIGKRLAGLRVRTKDGEICSIKGSVTRNSTLAVGLVLWKIPFIGWLLLAAVITLELVILVGSKRNARLGDELAGTSVQEEVRATKEI